MTHRSALCAMAIVSGIVACIAMAPSAMAGESLAIKPGAWELIITTQASGTSIPPEVLAQMPPERRAQLEQSMKARAAQPKTQIAKECLTQADLDQYNIFKEAEDEDTGGRQCLTKMLSQSSHNMEMEKSCPAPAASTTHIALEAKTAEAITATVDVVRPGSGKIHSEMKGRWLRASCAGMGH